MCAKRSQPTNWASLLQQELNKNARTPPGTGWLTRDELKATWKVGFHKLYMILNKLIAQNKVEKFEGFVYTNGKSCTRTWYRIK